MPPPQVLDWIENPVPASQLNISCLTPTELAAELPGGMLCTEPSAGCEYGTFNSTTCICACQVRGWRGRVAGGALPRLESG